MVLLWRSGGVQDKRRAYLRDREEAEEAGDLLIRGYTEGEVEEGRLEMFQGKKVCSKGVGAQSWLCCFHGGWKG